MSKVRRTRTVGQKQNDISKRVGKFLDSDVPAMREIRKSILQPLLEVGEVGVVGGLVRDIIRYGVDRRPISDIDLVIQGSPSAVDAIAIKLGAKKNRFGGYNATTDYFKVDFWALSTTWARTNANVPISKLDDLVDSTFFNWDAVIYSITNDRTIFRDRYLEDIESHMLEINLEATASHKGNVIRALRRLYGWQASPGPLLIKFLQEAESAYTWDDIIKQEEKSFYNSYLDNFHSFKDYFEYVDRSLDQSLRPTQLSLFPLDDLTPQATPVRTRPFYRSLKSRTRGKKASNLLSLL